jgi:hypothetical protein
LEAHSDRGETVRLVTPDQAKLLMLLCVTVILLDTEIDLVEFVEMRVHGRSFLSLSCDVDQAPVFRTRFRQ